MYELLLLCPEIQSLNLADVWGRKIAASVAATMTVCIHTNKHTNLSSAKCTFAFLSFVSQAMLWDAAVSASGWDAVCSLVNEETARLLLTGCNERDWLTSPDDRCSDGCAGTVDGLLNDWRQSKEQLRLVHKMMLGLQLHCSKMQHELHKTELCLSFTSDACNSVIVVY